MQGNIISVTNIIEKGKKSGRVETSDGTRYTIYQLPEDIQERDKVEFNVRTSRVGKEYAVFEEKVATYYDIYGEKAELEAIQRWIDTISGLRERVIRVESEHQSGHDYRIFFNDGSQTIVEVKNEENYWYKITGNITIDAISAFDIVSNDVREYLIENKNWIKVEYYQRFLKGIRLNKRGTLYESDADIMVKCIIDGDFVKAYNMQQLKSCAKRFEETYNLRVNDKRRYGIVEKHESATYCIKPSVIRDYEINNYDEIPKR